MRKNKIVRVYHLELQHITTTRTCCKKDSHHERQACFIEVKSIVLP